MLSTSLTKVAVRGPLMTQARNMTVVSGPPRVKISKAERAVHGLAIAVGVSIIPCWVLGNIKNYRAHQS